MFEELLKDNCFAPDEATRNAAAEQLEAQYNCEIAAVEMNPSVQFAHHARGCTIMAGKICAGVVIFQNVTIGTNQKFNKITQKWENVGNPIIAENVIIADGAKIFGPIIIGKNSVISASSIVTKDVPENSLVFGVNQIRPKNPDLDYIFHSPMISREETIAANQKLIKKFNTK